MSTPSFFTRVLDTSTYYVLGPSAYHTVTHARMGLPPRRKSLLEEVIAPQHQSPRLPQKIVVKVKCVLTVD